MTACALSLSSSSSSPSSSSSSAAATAALRPSRRQAGAKGKGPYRCSIADQPLTGTPPTATGACARSASLPFHSLSLYPTASLAQPKQPMHSSRCAALTIKKRKKKEKGPGFEPGPQRAQGLYAEESPRRDVARWQACAQGDIRKPRHPPRRFVITPMALGKVWERATPHPRGVRRHGRRAAYQRRAVQPCTAPLANRLRLRAPRSGGRVGGGPRAALETGLLASQCSSMRGTAASLSFGRVGHRNTIQTTLLPCAPLVFFLGGWPATEFSA